MSARVQLWGHTTAAPDFAEGTYDLGFWPRDRINDDGVGVDADFLIEASGRNCYQSWSRPNPATDTNEKYLQKTLHGDKHWSIAEHASATFFITGVSRSFLCELSRHRHLSLSVQSQRYVDESESEVVIPPALRAPTTSEYTIRAAHESAQHTYKNLVATLVCLGTPRKQAREAARAVLPNATETKIVATGNYRVWFELLSKRLAPGADAEFREVAGLLLDELLKLSPVVFGPLDEEARRG